MEHDTNGLRILARDECLALLARGGLGRVGLSHQALPVILPVSFGLLDDAVVFEAAGEGFLSRAARRHDVVCFEADSVDAITGEAWSVVVTGRLEQVESCATRARAAELGLKRWLPGAEGAYLFLPTTMVTGRHTARDAILAV